MTNLFVKSLASLKLALKDFQSIYSKCHIRVELNTDEFVVYSDVDYLGQQKYLVRICNNRNTKVNVQYWSEGNDNISYLSSPLTYEEAKILLEDAIILDFQRNLTLNATLKNELSYLKDNFDISKLLTIAMNSKIQN